RPFPFAGETAVRGGLPSRGRKIRLSVREQKKCCVRGVRRKPVFALSFLVTATFAEAQVPKASPVRVPRAHPAKTVARHDDSVASKTSTYLALRSQEARKADGLSL